MLPFVIAQLRFGELIAAYVVVSLIFFVLAAVVVTMIKDVGRRLVLLGLLTVIASIGYSVTVIPAGVAVASTMAKLGAVMVFGGIVSWLLAVESRCEGSKLQCLSASTQPSQLPAATDEMEA